MAKTERGSRSTRGAERNHRNPEGPTTAADGDWIVRGADGEEWPIPADEFALRYVELDQLAKMRTTSEDGR